MERELASRGFRNLVRWRRGVDTELFRPRDEGFSVAAAADRRLCRAAGGREERRCVSADGWTGSKLVIGDGPERARLKRNSRRPTFAGYRFGEDLATHLAAADILVFPSRTDTFGLVNLEAMACGVPVAAYPVTGPIDVIEDGLTGALDEDLARAARRALEDRSAGLP